MVFSSAASAIASAGVAMVSWISSTGVLVPAAVCGNICQGVVLLLQVLQPKERVLWQQPGPAAQGRLQLRLPV